MDSVPPPPPDSDQKNIIDKLAQFVARNGPEFENMTKNKQKGNPKFQFLYCCKTHILLFSFSHIYNLMSAKIPLLHFSKI